MKKTKQQYLTYTSYLAKTNKNVDMYRLYNPKNENLKGLHDCELFEFKFYKSYFCRHEITRRNLLTIFSIYTFQIKATTSDKEFSKIAIDTFFNRIKFLSKYIGKFEVSFRGGNIIFKNYLGKKEEISWFTLSRIANDIYQIDKNIYNSLSYAA